MIGDRMDTDIIAGLEAGMRTVLVLTGIMQADEIEPFPVPAAPGGGVDRRPRRARSGATPAGSTPRGHVGVDPGPVEEGIRRPGAASGDARGRRALRAGPAMHPRPRASTRDAPSRCYSQVPVCGARSGK